MNDELALIDSNILSYVFDESEPEKRRICADLIADCWKRKLELAVSVQNLSEFYVVVTKKISNPISTKVARNFIELIIDFQGWHVINYNAHTIISAISISTKHDIHYWDALLVATMRENKIFSIHTENENDFNKIPWIRLINPFEIIGKNQ